MKFLESKRNQAINNYILISQVIFFLLIGILVFRVADLSFLNYFLNMPVVLIFCLLLGVIPLLQTLKISSRYYQIIDFALTGIYLCVVCYLLVQQQQDMFKLALIMPVIIMSLKYGRKLAFWGAALSIWSVFVVSFFQEFISIDADIMFSGIIVLLAWLLGNMTETDYAIRTELERLATHDELTDILNHRSFQNLLDFEISRAEKDATSVGLILLDIDYFKYFNDAYGHQEGDQVLKDLARMLKETVGDLGHCARYGGEEFAVILPEKDIKAAKDLGELIRRRIEEHPFPGSNVFPQGKMTVSVGVAEFPLNADSKDKLIKKADEALYRAKFVSKNRVESYYSIFDEISLILKEEEKEMFNSISAFTMVINAKDRYTYGHSLRVMEMAKNLTLRVEGTPELIQDISFGALLHDIGKVEISREVLNKPARLTEREWEIFRQHPKYGAEIIDPLKSLKFTKEIVLYHHENYDGSGYPEGIKGNAIPIGARILRIVDSFDAMTTDRPYKDAMSMEQALEEMSRYSGIHYDPWLLEEFKKMMWESVEKSGPTCSKA